MNRIAGLWICALGLALASARVAGAADPPFLILQSTTSTQNSGLLDYLSPLFAAETGIELRVVAVGTGQALRNGRRGDGDVLLIHHREGEEAFVSEGYGVARHDVMYNDFVLVGPGSDPAGIAGSADADAALREIAALQALFASRGDDSGTHRKERSLWESAGIDPDGASGTWYRETGSGMGATLNAAVAMGAYTLTDRGTWLSFRNKGDFRVVLEGDPPLFNPYSAILVNPERHPRVRAAEGQQFIAWLVGPAGQAAIAAFQVDGQQLFYPNAPSGSAAGRGGDMR